MRQSRLFNTFCTVFRTMCYQGTAVYGATHLADLTEEEFKENYLGFKRSEIESHQRTFVCLQTFLLVAGQEGTIRQRSTGRRPRSQTWSCPSLLTGGNMARSRMSRIRCRPFSHFSRIEKAFSPRADIFSGTKIEGYVRLLLGFQCDRQRGGAASNHQW